MLRPLLPLLVAPGLVLACSAAPAQEPGAGARGGGSVAAGDAGGAGFVPIRFGDPDALAYEEPLFLGATHDPAVPAPEEVLGQPVGSRIAHHHELLEAFERLAEGSPRVALVDHGRTHEGRRLVHAVVTSEANHARLDAIRADLARLHDPRGLDEASADAILARAVPVAWLGYSIHGDELSGSDAGLAVAHHLAASTDDDVAALLDALVVVIDPCMNPDGRERILGQIEQQAGYTPSLDYASMHRGRWPYGRGNHYLFDLNRDWMAGTQPETRARWEAVLGWHPQLFVDAHEMGPLDTFLFYPQAEPLNPHFAERHAHWHGVYAADAARAFDERGWSYYTREWADGWAPFYSDAWASLVGALGILYEQASTAGSPLRRPTGEVSTYREAVHHQATASLANLRTLAANRDAILADYLANARRNADPEAPGNGRAFLLSPARHPERVAELVDVLRGQGVEVAAAAEPFEATRVESHLGRTEERRPFPAGTLVVPAAQPMAQLVKAYLSFDLRMDEAALRSEREHLERKGETKIYDLTAWSLPHALDVDSWWADAPDVPTEAVGDLRPPAGVVPPPEGGTAYAWACDAADDAAVRFAARAMEHGLSVRVSDRPFTTAGRGFSRGSVLVRRHETPAPPDEVAARVTRAAEEAGARVFATATGRSPDEGPDLGGGRFALLSRPRVAVLANAPVDPGTYGHAWHLLDVELGVPFALLDAQALGWVDLRRYDVLVLPPGDLSAVLEPERDRLERWVEAGGTLVALGDAAEVAIDLELASTVRRADALEELPSYAAAVARERAALDVALDPAVVWGDVAPADGGEDEDEDGGDGDGDDAPEPPDEEEEAWAERFAPYGVVLLAEVDPDAWITAGCAERLPVLASGPRVLLAKPPVDTAVRLRPADELRLSGLVWPEARERLADAAWLTVEARGDGQVILFAAMPAFRGYWDGTARLLANAVVLGPGLGASRPFDW